MSIKVTKTEYYTEVYYSMDFWFDNNSSYTFQCDEKGNVLENKNTSQALKNYHWCLENLDKFIRYGIEKHEAVRGGQRVGFCKCGYMFDMYNQYLGTCECPKCGQWYNLAGQEVLSPYQYNADMG